MTVKCQRHPECGQDWPRDPALEVPCPECRAPIGQRCRRPSGHPIFKEPAGQPGVHAQRDRDADAAGHYGECPMGLCGCENVAKRKAETDRGHLGTRHRARAKCGQAGLTGLPLFEPELPL